MGQLYTHDAYENELGRKCNKMGKKHIHNDLKSRPTLGTPQVSSLLEDKSMNNENPHICLNWLCCHRNLRGEAVMNFCFLLFLWIMLTEKWRKCCNVATGKYMCQRHWFSFSECSYSPNYRILNILNESISLIQDIFGDRYTRYILHVLTY